MNIYGLVQAEFGTPWKPSDFSIVRSDEQGAYAHAGFSRRAVEFQSGNTLEVAGLEFVVVRQDWRRRRVASSLVRLLHEEARKHGLTYIVAFTDLTEFYQKLGYRQGSELGVFTRGLTGAGWLRTPFQPVGEKW